MTTTSRKGRGAWAVIVFLLLATVGFGATLPLGPKEADEGRITGFHYVRGGVSAGFVSDQDGLTGRTALPLHHGCKVGDHIRLKRWKRIWGTGFQPVDDPPCAALFPQQ